MNPSTFARGLIVSAALLCATAHADDTPPQCKYVKIAELPLRYSGPTLQVTTDGTINGVTGPMLVDTGAGFSSLTRTATERRDLPLSMTGRYAEGVGGASRLYNTRLREFTVGPAKSAKGYMTVIGDTGSAPTYDAIVGAPFLLQTDMELSLAEKKMRFFRSLNCDKKSFLGYWTGDIFEIPFERSFDESPNPHFTVEVNGVKMDAIIDSGAQTTVIMASAAKRAGLKLETPGSTRLGYSVGVGSDRVRRWSTIVDRLKIGDELVQHAEVAVLETTPVGGVEVLLGDDYLRAHRVLFVMSQEKLYISYLGGEPFKPRTSLEPWLVQEAESGNADAQLILASVYGTGRGVAKDPAQAAAWFDKAAASGSPLANLQLGRRLMGQHQYQEAATRLRDALDKLPAERTGALWLFLARVHMGQADLGKQELEKAFARSDRDDWPAPLADFYLGRIDEAGLLKAAADEKAFARTRTCSATGFMSELYDARGDKEKAESKMAEWRAQCRPPVKTASATASATVSTNASTK
jgi:predicted aspartyl protease